MGSEVFALSLYQEQDMATGIFLYFTMLIQWNAESFNADLFQQKLIAPTRFKRGSFHLQILLERLGGSMCCDTTSFYFIGW